MSFQHFFRRRRLLRSKNKLWRRVRMSKQQALQSARKLPWLPGSKPRDRARLLSRSECLVQTDPKHWLLKGCLLMQVTSKLPKFSDLCLRKINMDRCQNNQKETHECRFFPQEKTYGINKRSIWHRYDLKKRNMGNLWYGEVATRK